MVGFGWVGWWFCVLGGVGVIWFLFVSGGFVAWVVLSCLGWWFGVFVFNWLLWVGLLVWFMLLVCFDVFVVVVFCIVIELGFGWMVLWCVCLGLFGFGLGLGLDWCFCFLLDALGCFFGWVGCCDWFVRGWVCGFVGVGFEVFGVLLC